MTNRRDFLRTGFCSGAVFSFGGLPPSFLTQAAAAEHQAADTVLVVLQLSGGNDGLNTVVPFQHPVYRASRPTLRISAADVLPINDELGFHPAARGLADLWEDNKLSIIQGVGYAQPNRSHFESMDIWHSCVRKTASREHGWLGRFLDQSGQNSKTSDTPAIHLGKEKLPFALMAKNTPPTSIRSIDRFRLEDNGNTNQRKLVHKIGNQQRGNGNDLLNFVQSGTSSALEVSERIRQARSAYKAAVAYPDNELAEKLKIVAQLIDAGLSTRIYYVTLNGFDTHARQANGHAALLKTVASSVAAFIQDVAARSHGDRVALLAFSEFGRRVKENASKGTDHGTAAPVFVAGNRIKPGLVGPMPDLTDLDQGDLKFHTDFRRVYSAVLQNWLSSDARQILNGSFQPVDIFQKS